MLGLDRSDDLTRVREEAVRARDRAGEAFDGFLNERGAKPLEPRTAARMVAAGSQVLLAADLLVAVAIDQGYRANACPDGAATVNVEVGNLLHEMRQLAARLDGGGRAVTSSGPPSADVMREAATACMRRAGRDEGAARSAMALVIAGEWAQNLARLEADLERAVSEAAAAATRPRLPLWRGDRAPR